MERHIERHHEVGAENRGGKLGHGSGRTALLRAAQKSSTFSLFCVAQLAPGRQFLDAFTEVVRNGDEDGLAAWLDQAKASGLAAFARALLADLDAVVAALREPWSNGQPALRCGRIG